MSIKKEIIIKHFIIALFICLMTSIICDLSTEQPYQLIDAACGAIMIVCVAIHCIRQYEDQIISFIKLNDDATVPTKRREDAGYDVYPSFEDKWMILNPDETTMVPTGIASAFSKDYCFVLKERGSTGSKGIGQRAGVIDSNYRGEWFVPITNHNPYPLSIVKEEYQAEYLDTYGISEYVIYPYEKAIAQALLVPVPNVETRCLTTKSFYEKYEKSNRGEGALGSTGK